MTYKLDYKDLLTIVDSAKGKMMSLSLPLYVSQMEIEHGQTPSLAIAESILMFLNQKGLLVEPIEIDYTSDYMDNDSVELGDKELKKI